MAKRNYNKISTMAAAEKTTPVDPVIPETEIKNDEPEQKVAIIGIVANCGRLNVRMKPDAKSDVVCEVLSKSELMIDPDESTEDWFKVCTAAGSEGFCMKQFIEVQQ